MKDLTKLTFQELWAEAYKLDPRALRRPLTDAEKKEAWAIDAQLLALQEKTIKEERVAREMDARIKEEGKRKFYPGRS